MKFLESARNILSNPDRFKAFIRQNKRDILQWVILFKMKREYFQSSYYHFGT